MSIPERRPEEQFIASSIQFLLALVPAGIERFLHECVLRGLYIKWFGLRTPQLDLRTPLSLTEQDCELIGQIVAVAGSRAMTGEARVSVIPNKALLPTRPLRRHGVFSVSGPI